MMFPRPNRAGRGSSTWSKEFLSLSAAYADKSSMLNGGDKIILPPSALNELSYLNIEYPMLFRIENTERKCMFLLNFPTLISSLSINLSNFLSVYLSTVYLSSPQVQSLRRAGVLLGGGLLRAALLDDGKLAGKLASFILYFMSIN